MSVENFKFAKKKFLTDPQLTFESLVGQVRSMGLSEDVTAKLLNKARTMPPGSLNHFLQNINTHIANVSKTINTTVIPPQEVKDGNQTE